jgi:elongation factor 3
MAPAATATAPAHVDPIMLKAANAASGEAAPVASDFDASQLFVADKATRDAATQALVSLAEKDGPQALTNLGLAKAFVKALGDKKSPAAREGAASTIRTLAKGPSSIALETVFVESGLLSALLDAFADKTPAVRTVAIGAVRDVIKAQSPWAATLVLPPLLLQIKTAGKWQVKTGALEILNQLIKSAPSQTARAMPDIVPVLADVIWDTKAEVKKAARDTLTKATALVSNKDIERFIPALISALINPVEEVPSTIQLLSATTFVSEVDAPTLSLMVPLLSRGLSEKLTATKRKVAV